MVSVSDPSVDTARPAQPARGVVRLPHLGLPAGGVEPDNFQTDINRLCDELEQQA